MKIYVVTKGVYSDYHIITATPNEELAEHIREKFSDNYGDARIETFEDAEIFVKPCYYIQFDKTGNVSDLHETNCEYDYNEQERYNNQEGDFWTYVVADSPESATKIAAERRAVYLASELGL